MGDLIVAVTQRVDGSTLAFVGSGRSSIVAATNGSQRIGGWNPRWRSPWACESNLATWFATYNAEFVAAIVYLVDWGKLHYCCCAEGRRFDTLSKWLTATQHSGGNNTMSCRSITMQYRMSCFALNSCCLSSFRKKTLDLASMGDPQSISSNAKCLPTTRSNPDFLSDADHEDYHRRISSDQLMAAAAKYSSVTGDRVHHSGFVRRNVGDMSRFWSGRSNSCHSHLTFNLMEISDKPAGNLKINRSHLGGRKGVGAVVKKMTHF